MRTKRQRSVCTSAQSLLLAVLQIPNFISKSRYSDSPPVKPYIWGGSRISGKWVHMYKYAGVRFADFNISWKWNNLVSLRPNYFIFIGYLKTGRRGGRSSEPPETTLDPPLPSIYSFSKTGSYNISDGSSRTTETECRKIPTARSDNRAQWESNPGHCDLQANISLL